MTAAATPVPPVASQRSGSGSALRTVFRFFSGLVLLLAAMALVAVVVAAFTGIRVRVERTGSMAPALQAGDLVLMRQTPLAQIRQGDVIGVRNDTGRVIVHRVRSVQQIGATMSVTTQGDANPTSETWTLRPDAQVAQVQGRIPEAGSVVESLRGPMPVLLMLLAAVLIAISQLRTIWSRN